MTPKEWESKELARPDWESSPEWECKAQAHQGKVEAGSQGGLEVLAASCSERATLVLRCWRRCSSQEPRGAPAALPSP